MILNVCFGPINFPYRMKLDNPYILQFSEDCAKWHRYSNPGLCFIDSFRPKELIELDIWYADSTNYMVGMNDAKEDLLTVQKMCALLVDLETVLTGLLSVEEQIQQQLLEKQIVHNFMVECRRERITKEQLRSCLEKTR